MQISLKSRAIEDLDYWRKTDNQPVLNKIARLMDSVLENPFKGIGKPEQLKYQFKGVWSRRITKEHRFVYQVAGDQIIILSLRGHYE